jgi:uncharacterized membrane protein YphA (DoxX/SURF4 family)
LVRFRRPRRLWLQKLFSTFPEGWPGLGLVLMRLTVGLSAIVQGIGTFVDSAAQLLSCAIGSLEILVGAALLIGFVTPITGACASLGNLAIAVSWFQTSSEKTHDKTVVALYLVVISIAITLLGPGAFSLDARLFGRREIIIPEASRPPLHDVQTLKDKEKA